MRTLTGLTWEQIGRTTGSSLSGSQRKFALHGHLIEEDPIYASNVAALSSAALAACHAAGSSGQTG